MNEARRFVVRAAGILGLVCFPLVAAIPAAAEDDEGVEVGVDAVMAFRLYDNEWSGFPINVDDAFLIGLPTKIRAGFPIAQGLSMEPSFAFDLVSVGDYTAHEIDVGLSFLRQLGGERGKTRTFLRVGGFYHAIGDDDDTNSQFSLSAGLGAKLPMADRLDFRVEIGAKRNFSNNDYLGSWDLGSVFGLSFYTR